MGNKNHIVAPVCDKVIKKQVDQWYDIVDGIFNKPHNIVIAIHRWLVGHCHHAAIDLQSNFRF